MGDNDYGCLNYIEPYVGLKVFSTRCTLGTDVQILVLYLNLSLIKLNCPYNLTEMSITFYRIPPRDYATT